MAMSMRASYSSPCIDNLQGKDCSLEWFSDLSLHLIPLIFQRTLSSTAEASSSATASRELSKPHTLKVFSPLIGYASYLARVGNCLSLFSCFFREDPKNLIQSCARIAKMNLRFVFLRFFKGPFQAKVTKITCFQAKSLDWPASRPKWLYK